MNQHVSWALRWEGPPQLLILTELKSLVVLVYLLIETSDWKRREGKEMGDFPKKAPDEELRKSHIPNSLLRSELASQHWWQAGKDEVLTPVPCITLVMTS